MTGLNLSRQSLLVPPNELTRWNIHIFGVGSVGSHLALLLAKTGFQNLIVYDMDTVDEENIGPQAFMFEHLGQNKVDAIKDLIEKSTGTIIRTNHGRITEESEIELEPHSIYICVFDSFEARKVVYNKVKDFPGVFMDGRIGAYNLSHFMVDLIQDKQKEEYEKTFPKDNGEGSNLACGEKASAFINYEIAGRMVSNLIRYVKGENFIKRFMGNVINHEHDLEILHIRQSDDGSGDNNGTI
jgi:predicted ThiF/HesA family dinucleotide-utilizing enzyme